MTEAISRRDACCYWDGMTECSYYYVMLVAIGMVRRRLSDDVMRVTIGMVRRRLSHDVMRVAIGMV